MTNIIQISPQELHKRLEVPGDSALLLDVREGWEVDICQIAGSTNIPLQHVPNRIHELPNDRDIVVICHHGVRSYHAAMFLTKNGLTRIFNLRGGIDAWAKTVDTNMALY